MMPNVVHPAHSLIISIRVKLSRLGDYWIGFLCILLRDSNKYLYIYIYKKIQVLFTRKSIYYIKELMVSNCKNL